MSFEDIRIYRDLQVVNRYVQLPPNEESDKSALHINDAPSGSVRLTGGSGAETGSRHGQHEIYRLEGITPDSWYTTDPVEELRP